MKKITKITLSTAVLLTMSSGGILRPFPSFSNNQVSEAWKCYTQSNEFIGVVKGDQVMIETPNDGNKFITVPITEGEAINKCFLKFQQCESENQCKVKIVL